MVFRVLLASILILGQARSMAQIDKLTTTEDVVQFVRRIACDNCSLSAKMGFQRIRYASFDSLAAAYHLRSFEKEDLDGNGLTDLIFNGSEYGYSQSDSVPYPVSFAILSFGNDSFYVRELHLGVFDDIAAHALRLDGKPYIQTIRVTSSRKGVEYHIDTLAWRFNAFIEKGLPVKRKIIQIDYTCFNGLAYESNMTLRIIKDSVRLKKERSESFNGQENGGVYLARLDNNTCQRLYGLLDAINFTQLNDSFQVSETDATTGTLKITYDSGQTKMITDYGACGTYGLKNLHGLLFDLTNTQQWVNADPVMPRRIASLRSDREVLGLIRTLDMDYPFLDFEPDTPVNALPDYRERLAAFGAQRWQKADIDGNGYTDLLFNGYLNEDWKSRQYSIVVLSFGGDSVREQEISGANGFFAAKIIRCFGHNCVQINYLEAIEDSTKKKGYRLIERNDTLTAYDGQIVELPPPALHHLEKLSVREQIGDDSIDIMHDTIRWYKNDAEYPTMIGDSLTPREDSINLYILVDPNSCQKLLSLAAGIRFDRLNPDLLLPNKSMRYFSSTWNIEYDGGKRSQFIFDGLIGSYRLQALENCLWQLKHNRTDWQLVPKIK